MQHMYCIAAIEATSASAWQRLVVVAPVAANLDVADVPVADRP